MGIPSYFNHIIKNHGQIFKKLKSFKKIDNLYLDSNSIIYDVARDLDGSISKISLIQYEDKLLECICIKISEYISKIKPTFVYISFDGVAPVAKLEQQRQRRYKSHFIREKESIIKGENINLHKNKWNQTKITPGTAFMNKLDNYIEKYFSNPLTFGCDNIIVDGSKNNGEGEHKIFQYIRNHKDDHIHKNTLVYGLDADLIMLCLNHQHISDKINLFREKPDYSTDLDEYYDDNDICILDIKELSKIIVHEMTGEENLSNKQLCNDKIRDYILISFMLGNDFMPHFPSLNIRTNGIDIILDTYKHIIKKDDTICNGNKIKWRLMYKFIEDLSKNEYDYIKNEYIQRMKRNNDPKPNSISDKLKRFNLVPTFQRDVEMFIDPLQKGWEYRYYKSLFDLQINNEHRKNICNNYLEGLEWTLKYYTTGCINYRWYYKYHYPPLLVDLIKYTPYFDSEMVEENYDVVHCLTQLSYVLPGTSIDLLPDELKDVLLDRFKSYYSNSYNFKWAFCKYFWESHVDLPHIDIGEIEEIVNELLVEF